MSFNVGEQACLSECAVGFPFDGGHIADAGMHGLGKSNELSLRLQRS